MTGPNAPGGSSDLGVAVFQHGEDGVETGEDGLNLPRIFGKQRAVVGGDVAGAYEVEDGGAGFSGGEVVRERGVVAGESFGGRGG